MYNKSYITMIILGAALFVMPGKTMAALTPVKLPYAKGQSFVVSQGYNSLPTHIKKDAYALDLTQNSCDAYGKQVVAAAAGVVVLAEQNGYNGGYGTEMIIYSGNTIVARYAHMIPGSIVVGLGEAVSQGEPIGRIGDTGLVAGLACPAHPGTHLHFAMDTKNSDGTFTAYNPEPISGYMHITEGKWYRSDNDGQAATNIILGIDDSTTTPSSTATSTNIVISPPIIVATSTLSVGGVSSNPAPVAIPAPTSTSPSLPVQTPTSTSDQIAVPDKPATTTIISIPIVATDTLVLASTSVTTTSTLLLPVVAATTKSVSIFDQPIMTNDSNPSWYDQNWYQLGNGFSGTLNSLTLSGRINGYVSYSASQVFLQEYKDAAYLYPIQQFVIASSAPFTDQMATATFSGLSIPLKPYFYYRLFTSADPQNRSLILQGSASTTNLAMRDAYIYNVGRVETLYPFTPFMESEGMPASSTLMPPLTTPGPITEKFDPMEMRLGLVWGASSDPDWAGNPLHYEVEYSTSTVLGRDDWQQGSELMLVVFGNTYTIAIRAADDFGNVSAYTTTTWNFPPGFTPYILGNPLTSLSQDFVLATNDVLDSIHVFTSDFETTARYPQYVNCSLQLLDVGTGGFASSILASSDNYFSGNQCSGDLDFVFSSSSLQLLAGHIYRWFFQVPTGNPSSGATVRFYGTANNTAQGLVSDPAITNAKFTVMGSNSVLFAN